METTSPKQLAANQANAQKSRGPKSEKGKIVSRANALRHGILSQVVLIDRGSGQEDVSKFKALEEYITQELQPMGAIEEMLTDRIITGYWRLRRALITEVGAIRHHTDTFALDRLEGRLREADHNRDFLSITYLERTTSKMGLEEMLHVLDELEGSVQDNNLLSDDEIKKATEYFYHRSITGYSLDFWLRFFTLSARDYQKSRKKEEGIPVANAKKGMLGLIQDERKKLKFILETVTEKEELEDEHSLMLHNIPSKEMAEKLLRYETTIERSIYRALHELQRLQAARAGGAPPLPVAVDVDINKEG